MSFDGEKLRLGRLFYGWTQADLGQRVGSSRQYVHQLEIGTKDPSADMRAALASALSVNDEFFAKPIRNQVKPEQAHFRSLLTTPLAEKRQVLAHVTFFEALVDLLEQKLEFPDVDLPEFNVENIWAIDRLAEDARQFLGLNPSAPIQNMSRVLENAGVLVVHFNSIGEKVDALSVSRSRPVVIRSNAKQSVFRQRFDLAHELGHLVMHQGVETGDRETEAQANRFASSFLMPREVVHKAFPRQSSVSWDRIFQYKLKWGVAASAIVRRVHDLNIVDAAQYRLFNIKIAKSGQRKVERYDEDYPLEKPEILSQSIQALLDDGRSGIKYLCGAMGVGESFLARLVGDLFEPVMQETSSIIPFPASDPKSRKLDS